VVAGQAHGKRHDEGFTGNAGFAAEAAAYVGGDDADFAQGQVKGGGDEFADGVGRLAGGPEGDFAGAVDVGDGGMGLDLGMLDVGQGVDVFDDDVGGGKAPFDVALAQFEVVGDVGAGNGEDEGAQVYSPRLSWMRDPGVLMVMHVCPCHHMSVDEGAS
jgi:hypothetical protein